MPKAAEEIAVSPFVVVIDTAEQHPFEFRGMNTDADKKYRPLYVPRAFGSLGRHPNSLGDYSILGMEHRVAVERKSKEDAWSTILGWPASDLPILGRRLRFEQELANLSQLEAAAVVVECNFPEFIDIEHPNSKKTPETNAKILLRSVLAYMQDFRVPWLFAGSRQLAEVVTYRFLARFWKYQNEPKKILRKVPDSLLQYRPDHGRLPGPSDRPSCGTNEANGSARSDGRPSDGTSGSARLR